MKATLMFPLVGAALAESTASMAKNNNAITKNNSEMNANTC